MLILTVASAQATEWEYGTLILNEGTAHWFAPGADVRQVTPDSIGMELREVYGPVTVDTRSVIADALNVLGTFGWELVGIEGTLYVFKRPTVF